MKPKKKEMKHATIEILLRGEKIFGSETSGEYFVREYEDNVETVSYTHLTLPTILLV